MFLIKVVAAIIEKDGEFLLCRRGPGGNCEFLWEFPGGKIEEGESPFNAITREIKEELSLDIKPFEIFDEYLYSYPERDIYFYFIKAEIIGGEMKLNFHTETKWIKPGEKVFDAAPADIPVIEKLLR